MVVMIILFYPVSGSLPMGWSVADKLVFKKIREALGFQRCKIFVVGSAPTRQEVHDFFMSYDMPLMELYGMLSPQEILLLIELHVETDVRLILILCGCYFMLGRNEREQWTTDVQCGLDWGEVENRKLWTTGAWSRPQDTQTQWRGGRGGMYWSTIDCGSAVPD